MQGQARSYLNIHQNPVPPPPELYNGSQYFQYFDFSSSKLRVLEQPDSTAKHFVYPAE